MTAPQPDQQDHQLTEAEAAVVAAIALWLASRLAVRAVLLPRRLVDMLTSVGVAPKASRAAGRMALSVPLSGRSRWGSPSPPEPARPFGFGTQTGPTPSAAARIASEEPTMRARYIFNAARRLTDSLVHGEFIDGLKDEKRNLVAHVQAGKKRAAAAAALDEVAARAPGGLLQWHTVMDAATTPDCARLDRVLFTMDNPPGIPGAMHPRCRCSALPALTVGTGFAAA